MGRQTTTACDQIEWFHGLNPCACDELGLFVTSQLLLITNKPPSIVAVFVAFGLRDEKICNLSAWDSTRRTSLNDARLGDAPRSCGYPRGTGALQMNLALGVYMFLDKVACLDSMFSF